MVAVAYTLAGFVQLLTEGEIRNYLGRQRMKRQIESLKGHTIIVGFGRVGVLVGRGADRRRDRRSWSSSGPSSASSTSSAGDIPTSTPTRPRRRPSARPAWSGPRRWSRSCPTDAENVFLTLTARRIAPNVEIIARAEQPVTLKTLRQAGADHVVMPAAIGAHRIVSLLTNPSAVEFAELVTRRSSLAIEMEEVPVKSRGPLDGLSLRDADIGRRTGVMVIAVKRADGRVEFPPSGDEPFAAGDTAVLLGRRSNLDLFRAQLRELNRPTLDGTEIILRRHVHDPARPAETGHISPIRRITHFPNRIYASTAGQAIGNETNPSHRRPREKTNPTPLRGSSRRNPSFGRRPGKTNPNPGASSIQIPGFPEGQYALGKTNPNPGVSPILDPGDALEKSKPRPSVASIPAPGETIASEGRRRRPSPRCRRWVDPIVESPAITPDFRRNRPPFRPFSMSISPISSPNLTDFDHDSWVRFGFVPGRSHPSPLPDPVRSGLALMDSFVKSGRR